jgi:NADPH:quinone reductase-like Zn-dependent oxidoreductase
VFGMTGGVGGLQGSLAEYAAVDAELLAEKPANLSMREAAALPLREAARLVEAGKVFPRLDPRQFTLSSISEAYSAHHDRTAAGKIVINVDAALSGTKSGSQSSA